LSNLLKQIIDFFISPLLINIGQTDEQHPTTALL